MVRRSGISEAIDIDETFESSTPKPFTASKSANNPQIRLVGHCHEREVFARRGHFVRAIGMRARSSGAPRI